MKNLIDEIYKDHIEFSKILDLLAEQLDIIHTGNSADYHLMLDAVSYIENYPEIAFIPIEDAVFKVLNENYNFVELNDAIKRLRADHHELKALTHKVHDYIDAALEDSIFEKKSFEQQLESCIQRQRDHMTAEENIIFPLLKNNCRQKNFNESVEISKPG